MKTPKLLVTLGVCCSAIAALAACNSTPTISIWVGDESAAFYQQKAEAFIAENYEGKYKIKVTGTDVGSIAGTLTQDISACADIYTVAHDNIGKLVEKSCARPLLDESLTAQIAADNKEVFVKAVKAKPQGADQEYIFAAPYISQALFLYYNKAKVTAEEAKTFEGLQAAAVRSATESGKEVKGVTVTGTDGYNFSFTTLATKADDHSTSVKIYEGGNRNTGSCWFQGEDTIATAQWAQRYFGDKNGGAFPSSAGWAVDLQNGAVLSVVGGAWHYNAAQASLGDSNLGITVLPTFTLTAADVKDTTFPANTVMQAGSFVDCKVLMINSKIKNSKYAVAQDLIKYLTSKDVQNLSFKECRNVPAYDGASTYIESIASELPATVVDLAKAQTGAYGIPQPFVSGLLNTFFYSKKAPEAYVDMCKNESGLFSTTRAVRELCYKVQYIWQKGLNPETYPENLPAEI
ncbi:MAG: extracellular solute-binding protein [Bacilli bacterium]|nr:extracellular solute-binding protein [Bacilli bacterium]